MKTSEKNIKKTGNLLIREPSAKTKDVMIKTETTLGEVKKWRKSETKMQLQQQKQLMMAQNLNENEIRQISEEANRLVNKKVKDMEKKLEMELVQVLELECNKLGMEIQKQKAENNGLRNENYQLKKRIEILSKRLEDNHREANNLVKQNDTVDMKMEQAKDQIQRLKGSLRKKEQQLTNRTKGFEQKKINLQKDLLNKNEQINELTKQVSKLKQETQELIEQLQHYRGQGQNLKENLDERLREFQKTKSEMQSKFRHELDKKSEKITKYQVQCQQLEEKLRQEQNHRKKYVQKCKDYEKQINKKCEMVKQLEGQIVNYKKRINDLSILKSTNKTILDEKISKLTEENQKLKFDLQKLKKKKNGQMVEQEEAVQAKPYLFGPNDY